MTDGRRSPGTRVLSTKLHPPRRRRAGIARSRLADDDGPHAPALTLVSAPAGFGKTTLVADRFAGDATAWLSLDAADDDPVRFWTYVVAACATVVPDLGDETDELLSDPHAPTEAVVTSLINDLDATAPEIVLVLDDYHVIQDPDVHASVAFLVDRLPRQVQLVITTRADPPLPLSAWRASGELREVRAADLRFTLDEASDYLTDVMGLALGADEVAALEDRTEGWIAALQLAALSLQGRDDPAAFVTDFAGDDRFILDYLTDEVLERQRPELRSALLDTSILHRLTGPLVSAVTDRSDGPAILDELDRTNLFLVALDDRRSVYRYHHLFGDVLRARLDDEAPERVPELHRRASAWYADHGELQDAVGHALAGDDPERAAELIELVAPAMHQARQEGVVREWLESLPEHVYADRPVLATMLVGARMATGDGTGVRPLLDLAQRHVDAADRGTVANEEEYARLPATIAMYRAASALLDGDTAATERHAARVLELVGIADPLQRGAAAALLGLARWNLGDLDAARIHYESSIACFEDGDYLPDVMGCTLALTDIQLTQGRLRDARRAFDAALRHTVERPGMRGAADMHAGLALLAVERNDLDGAATHLSTCTELGERMGLPQHPYRWRVAAASLRRASGDLDGALELLDEAAARYETDFSPPVRPVAAMRARVQIERGDLDAAERWAAGLGLGPDDELHYVREYEHVTLARLLVARGSDVDVARATALLERLLVDAERGHRTGSAIEILVALATAQLAGRRSLDARRSTEDALGRSDAEGYARVYLDAGPGMVAVLRGMDGDPGERAARVLATAATPAPARRAAGTGPDELSDRELDVLRMLRSDLSGPHIARELHVSLNTLRTHTKHIYTKLGVTSRREALTRAAELGL